VRDVEGLPVTELAWSDLLVAMEALQHRLVRLSGDAAVLSDAMAEARAGTTVDRWAGEVGRIARELAQSLEVIERIKPDAAADTDVIPLSEIAGDE
jgi:hypothetical protein